MAEGFQFRDLGDLLAQANKERSGDQLAGIAEAVAKLMSNKDLVLAAGPAIYVFSTPGTHAGVIFGR
ncbi:MAG TPA: hypothetical protein VJX29_03990 [Candidatus Acidoferrales bacterium]|nr:hypothetical protein [Candidatus Acidoferrales bacterium]